MHCLTANMYMLSERGVGSLIPKVKQTEGRAIEDNSSRILASCLGLDLGQLPKVWSASPLCQGGSMKLWKEHNIEMSCKFVPCLLCNPGKVV